MILESPSIRVHLPRPQAPGDIDCAVQTLKRLAEYGARKNIVINLENDNPASEDPFRVVKVIETVNTPFLRALPDFCNSMQIQDDQEYDDRALRALFAHAFNISHVKNVEHHGGKTLRVDVDQIFAIAKKAGYRGYFSMEWSGGGDAYEPTRELIEASLRISREVAITDDPEGPGSRVIGKKRFTADGKPDLESEGRYGAAIDCVFSFLLFMVLSLGSPVASAQVFMAR